MLNIAAAGAGKRTDEVMSADKASKLPLRPQAVPVTYLRIVALRVRMFGSRIRVR